MSETRSKKKRLPKTPLSPVEKQFVRDFPSPPGHEEATALWRPPRLSSYARSRSGESTKGRGPHSPGSLSSLSEDPEPEPRLERKLEQTSWLADASSSEPEDSESEEEEEPRGRRSPRDKEERKSRERRPPRLARSRSSETLPDKYASDLRSPLSLQERAAAEPASSSSDSTWSSESGEDRRASAASRSMHFSAPVRHEDNEPLSAHNGRRRGRPPAQQQRTTSARQFMLDHGYSDSAGDPQLDAARRKEAEKASHPKYKKDRRKYSALSTKDAYDETESRPYQAELNRQTRLGRFSRTARGQWVLGGGAVVFVALAGGIAFGVLYAKGNLKSTAT